ncbi:MAG: LCP family protein [Oscillospiraceae bacterium]|nr:LCP family protein [Oscillospiraceae bacterium]
MHTSPTPGHGSRPPQHRTGHAPHPGSHPAHARSRKRRRLFPVWYTVIFILACIIVVSFLIYKIAAKPPSIDADAVTPDTISDTDQDRTYGVDPSEEDQPDIQPAAMVRRDNVYTFLIFGVDESGGSNTDTIMVGCYDVDNEALSIVSIPRDTLVRTSSVRKINSVYPRGGTEDLEAALERMLGIPIDFYVKVRLEGFIDLVDAIGGVWFDVPIDMHYWDPTADLHIDLDAGYQLLNGEQSMWLVRFRSGYATQDLGRMETQHAFFMALVRQALKLGNIKALTTILADNVETNLTTGNLLWFGEHFMDLNTDTIYMETLPIANAGYVYNGSSCVLLDSAGVLETVNAHLNPYNTDLTANQLAVFRP